MGHVVMTSAVAGVPEDDVLNIEIAGYEDPKRVVAFDFARKVTLRPIDVRRKDIAALQEHFTDEQIVEMVLAICRYNTMNRLADAFGVPLERENVFKRPPKPPEATEPPEPSESPSQ